MKNLTWVAFNLFIISGYIVCISLQENKFLCAAYGVIIGVSVMALFDKKCYRK